MPAKAGIQQLGHMGLEAGVEPDHPSDDDWIARSPLPRKSITLTCLLDNPFSRSVSATVRALRRLEAASGKMLGRNYLLAKKPERLGSIFPKRYLQSETGSASRRHPLEGGRDSPAEASSCLRISRQILGISPKTGNYSETGYFLETGETPRGAPYLAPVSWRGPN